MTSLIPPTGIGISLFRAGSPLTLAQATTESPSAGENPASAIQESLGSSLDSFTSFLPNIVGAIAIGIAGFIVALAVSWLLRNLLKKTNVDDTIASKITRRPPEDVPAAKWVGDAAYWVIILFTVIAVLEALDLTVVSQPLNSLLTTVFDFLPNLFSAGLLLVVAWAIATVVKAIVTRGLETLNLDERLAENTGVDPRQNSIRIHETLGNALYWFVFLMFLPLVLEALELNNGLLAPVQGLIDQFLAAIPKIILAAAIFAVGWLLAKVARGFVTNILQASGVDNLGNRVGLSSGPASTGISLSGLAGNIVYIFILIPAAIAALNALDIDAISDPAIGMLEQILDFIPLLLAAAVVLVVFYFIGRFIKELVTNLLSSAGFDGVLDALGLPEIGGGTASSTATTPSVGTAAAPGVSPGTTTIGSSTTQLQADEPQARTPSEIVGFIVLVAIMLFGAVTATEILQLDQLTLIVRALMEIAGQVLIGVIIFAVGVYIANLAYRLIRSSSSGSSNLLAQAARIAILAFVGAMALGQMGVAPNIVNLAFGLLLGAIAIAIAVAFGLGGRDVAGAQLKEWLDEIKR